MSEQIWINNTKQEQLRKTAQNLSLRVRDRQLRDLLFALLVIEILLIGIGLAFLFSNTSFIKLWNQIIFVSIGVIFSLIISRTPLDFLRYCAVTFFVATLVVNVLTFIPGISRPDSRITTYRWIEIGGYSLQVAELLHLGVIIVLSALYVSYKENQITKSKLNMSIILICCSSVTLVILQKDFSTSVYISMIMISLLVFVGESKKIIITLFGFAICAGFIVIKYGNAFRFNRIDMWLGKKKKVPTATLR